MRSTGDRRAGAKVRRLNTSARALTLSGSTGFSVTPPSLSQVPTIAPSAHLKSSTALSGVTPLPTSTGLSPAASLALRTFSRSGGLPVSLPVTTTPSALPLTKAALTTSSKLIPCRGVACLHITSASTRTSDPRSLLSS